MAATADDALDADKAATTKVRSMSPPAVSTHYRETITHWQWCAMRMSATSIRTGAGLFRDPQPANARHLVDHLSVRNGTTFGLPDRLNRSVYALRAIDSATSLRENGEE
jgi:hypothetical protein